MKTFHCSFRVAQGLTAVWLLSSANVMAAASAVVTSASGKAVQVLDLQAVYHPGGHWIGEEPPSTSTPRLLAILTYQDGKTQSLELPFSELSGVQVEKRPGPLGPKGAWFPVVRVRRRDGSRITLDLSFSTQDPKGLVTRTASLRSWTFSAGLTLDRHVVLQRLEGVEVLPSGTRRPFLIYWDDVKAIQFE